MGSFTRRGSFRSPLPPPPVVYDHFSGLAAFLAFSILGLFALFAIAAIGCAFFTPMQSRAKRPTATASRRGKSLSVIADCSAKRTGISRFCTSLPRRPPVCRFIVLNVHSSPLTLPCTIATSSASSAPSGTARSQNLGFLANMCPNRVTITGSVPVAHLERLLSCDLGSGAVLGSWACHTSWAGAEQAR